MKTEDFSGPPPSGWAPCSGPFRRRGLLSFVTNGLVTPLRATEHPSQRTFPAYQGLVHVLIASIMLDPVPSRNGQVSDAHPPLFVTSAPRGSSFSSQSFGFLGDVAVTLKLYHMALQPVPSRHEVARAVRSLATEGVGGPTSIPRAPGLWVFVILASLGRTTRKERGRNRNRNRNQPSGLTAFLPQVRRDSGLRVHNTVALPGESG